MYSHYYNPHPHFFWKSKPFYKFRLHDKLKNHKKHMDSRLRGKGIATGNIKIL